MDRATALAREQKYFSLNVLKVAAETTPTHLGTTLVRGRTPMEFAWTALHVGWRLQVQTISLATGFSNNWVDVPGSASTTRILILITKHGGAVFYRLTYP